MSFSLNETTLLSAVKSRSIFSVINGAFAPTYGIYYNTIDKNNTDKTKVVGQKVFTPSGWGSIEQSADAVIVNSPIEKGSYTSYNKVKKPREIRVQFLLEGWSAFSGALPNLTNFSMLSRSNLIDILDEMRTSASTYNIETPDGVFESYDLAHYDYSVTAKNGQTLLKVSAVFQAVMQTGEVVISSSTTKEQKTDNQRGTRNGAISTSKTISNTTPVTLDEAKKAWASANSATAFAKALSTTGSAIVSGVVSAAETVSEAYDEATNANAEQIKDYVSRFVKEIL
ncbi:phage baseplate protein [Dickeya poaceiphila]|uniref:Phage tail protein n=1 Tax=Dickeya poaceiphila TaxID=568768 RepID=A0A5B8IAU7_9GAMM|nr:hypothetical protein [Dickeya poaceiphila]QDX29560.1 hypothetical protein Dpoa569_0001345 [Dickeya poaceiphila]